MVARFILALRSVDKPPPTAAGRCSARPRLCPDVSEGNQHFSGVHVYRTISLLFPAGCIVLSITAYIASYEMRGTKEISDRNYRLRVKGY